MAEPVRLQRSRRKGARLVSPNGLPVVYVGRPTKWGNPFTVEGARKAGHHGSLHHLRGFCVIRFRDWLKGEDSPMGIYQLTWILAHLGELRGKNLACWCPLDEPCHADVLLEMANA